MIKRDELIKIGLFNKPHALNGELSFTFTDDVFDRTECPYFVCEIDGIFVPFFLEAYRFRSDSTALVKLVDVDSADDAKMFTNLDVYFPKSYLPETEDHRATKDYFLDFQIIDAVHGNIGRIVDIDDSTVNVLFVVEDESEAQHLIPAVDEFVEKIDEPNQIIYMKVPEGLFNDSKEVF